MDFDDDYTAAHEVRPYMLSETAKSAPQEDRELLMTRVKLEARTWMLRASIALNIGLITGWMISVALKP